MAPTPLQLLHIRDVKTQVNAYPSTMDPAQIQNERTIAYGVLAIVAIVKFGGGRDNHVDVEENVIGPSFKDLSTSETTTQASSQMLMAHGVVGRDMVEREKGKGRVE